MITNTEKQLYNKYLYISRTSRNKPVSLRKDFTDFNEQNVIHLMRINNLLKRYPHITAEDYFKAPYEVYPDEDFFDLSFYSGMKAVKAFTLYMKKLRNLPPDSDYQLEQIQSSLKFIVKFCIEKNISLSDYLSYQTGVTYDWMKHVKQYQVSIYTLMEFPEVYDKIMSIPEDERELLLGECGRYFLGYKTKYLKSTKASYLVTEAVKKIEKIINASRKT